MRVRLARTPELSERTFFLACGVLALLAAMLYAPALGYEPLALDDYGSLAEYRDAPLAAVLQRDHFGHLRPGKNALFWLAAHAPSEAHGSLRGLALLAHLATALLAARLLARVARSRWVGLFACALWALHPSTATVLGWLSASNLAFCGLGVALYLHAAKAFALGARRALWRTIMATSLAFAAAHHELALLAPLLAALDRENRPALRPIAADGSAVVALYVALALSAPGAAPSYRFAEQSRLFIGLNAARYLFANLSLWVWPFERFTVLERDEAARHLAAALLAWGALFGCALALRKLARRDFAPVYGIAWGALLFAPASNFLPLGNTPIAVHYGYLPGIGLSLAVACALAACADALGSRARAVLAGLGLVWVVALALESRVVLAAWSNEEALYRLALEHHPENPELTANLSAFYLRAGRYADADALLERAPSEVRADRLVRLNTLDLWLATGRAARVLADLSARDVRGDVELSLREARALQELARSREAALAFWRTYEAASRLGNDELALQAGYQGIIEHLRSDDAGAARRLLDELRARHPDRPELEVAARLLENLDDSSSP